MCVCVCEKVFSFNNILNNTLFRFLLRTDIDVHALLKIFRNPVQFTLISFNLLNSRSLDNLQFWLIHVLLWFVNISDTDSLYEKTLSKRYQKHLIKHYDCVHMFKHGYQKYIFIHKTLTKT